MKSNRLLILFYSYILGFSNLSAQSIESTNVAFIDLPKIRLLTMVKQEQAFTDKFGEPWNISSFTTTTKYKSGKERKVKCDQLRYTIDDAEITCFYFADTDNLGQVAVHLLQDKRLPDFKKFFLSFGVTPPSNLGKRKGFSGFYYYNLDNYEGFTRISVVRTSSGFSSIDFYIDRIE